MNFSIVSSISAKIAMGLLIGITLNLHNTLGNRVILRIFSLQSMGIGCLFICISLCVFKQHLIVFSVQVFCLLDEFITKYSTPLML